MLYLEQCTKYDTTKCRRGMKYFKLRVTPCRVSTTTKSFPLKQPIVSANPDPPLSSLLTRARVCLRRCHKINITCDDTAEPSNAVLLVSIL